MIRVTKIFTFESAHALHGYDGKCKSIHGHSYKLHVTVKGKPIDNEQDVKFGMVIDFGDINDIVKKHIIQPYDHATLLNKNSAHLALGEELERRGNKVVFTAYQPTCEMMLYDFAEKIKEQLPENVELASLRLYETENSYGEWRSEDQ